MQYQAECESTSIGRQSIELRSQAQEITKIGDVEKAHPLFVEAVSLFETNDRSAAAACCWYDLAESFKNIRSGVRIENLLEAKRLLERCLGNEARKRDPLRMALTHDALGQTLRHLASECADEGMSQSFLDEAINHCEQAVSIVNEVGFFGFSKASAYATNLGNSRRQAGDLDGAINAFEFAVDRTTKAEEYSEILSMLPFQNTPIPLIMSNLIPTLFVRNQGKDSERAFELLDKVVRDAPPTFASKTRLRCAGVLLNGSQIDQESAKKLLCDIDPSHLSPDEQLNFAILLDKSGDRHRALSILHHAKLVAMQARRTTVANHIADERALDVQKIALHEAQILAESGDAVAAFLVLENASALRFYDSVTYFAWRPSNPVDRTLWERKRFIGNLAVELDRLASDQSRVPNEGQRQSLEQCISELESQSEKSARFLAKFNRDNAIEEAQKYFRTIADLIGKAREHPSPVAFLQRQVEKFRYEVGQLDTILLNRDPASHPNHYRWNFVLDSDELTQILAEEPDQVFIRVCLVDELFAVALWLEEGSLVGRSERIPVDHKLLHNLTSMHLEAPDSNNTPNLSNLMRELSLDQVLPEGHHRHAVVLPSFLATLLPWAAAGPEGAQLIDTFDAITFLPNLTPFRMRQAPCPPRKGVVVVIPDGESDEVKTEYSEVAFSEPDKELQLEGKDATIANVIAHSATADTMVFYAHGRHDPEKGNAIRLTDGEFFTDGIDSQWMGCERVELWSCESGINLPTDHLTPTVDEAFGSDVEFHRAGVRSTIGSLWSVNAFVTAHILKHYRKRLAVGETAPLALAQAQRWWRDVAIPRIHEQMKTVPFERLKETIASSLGGASVSFDLGETLGPIAVKSPLSPDKAEREIARLSTPEAWAGFRFMGVCDRRPTEPWTDEHERPLTEEEKLELETLYASAIEQPPTIDLAMNARFNDLTTLEEESPPSPKQAIEVSRLYAQSRQSAHQHNLLRGLAWLHEVLATGNLSKASSKQLRTEAAHLWLELTRDEWPDRKSRPHRMIDPIFLARFASLFRNLLEKPLFALWLELLTVDILQEKQKAKIIDRKWPTVWKVVQQLPDSSYIGIRSRCVAGEALLEINEPPLYLAEPVIKEAKRIIQREVRNPEMVVFIHRLHCVASELSLRCSLPPIQSLVDSLLPIREIPRALRILNVRAGQGDVTAQTEYKEMLEHGIGQIESAHWGYPSDDRLMVWLSSGTPGASWHVAIGAYLSATLRNSPQTEGAVPFIASIHMGADLRLGPLNSFSRLLGNQLGEAATFTGPWQYPWVREQHLQQLEDSARITEAHRTQSNSERKPTPHRYDVFQTGIDEVLATVSEDVTCATGWVLASTLTSWHTNVPKTFTTAFACERQLLNLDTETKKEWPTFSQMFEHPELGLVFDVPRHLATLEKEIKELPEGVVLLGAFVGAAGEFLLGATWKDNDSLVQQTYISKPGDGWHVETLLKEMIQPRDEDFDAKRGISDSRKEIWKKLIELLDRPLAKILGSLEEETKSGLTVLAPRTLRSLPWIGLTAGGKKLVNLFSSVRLTPHLGFSRAVALTDSHQANPHTVCVMGQENEVGETRFGETAIETLRKSFPGVEEAEPHGPITVPEIIEGDVIKAQAERIQSLRFYGTASTNTLNTTTSGMGLSGGRVFTAMNLRWTMLPFCECVEIWGVTDDIGALRDISDGNRDRLPGLVGPFLAAGSASVIDQAWPVHDLVKAMVAECYGLIRRTSPLKGSSVLREALMKVTDRLESLHAKANSFSTITEVLEWLDQARMQEFQALGLNVSKVLRFAEHSDAPCVEFDSPKQLIEECADPVHLSAFRWWGV